MSGLVLVVDFEPRSAAATRALASASGCDVLVAGDARELEALLTRESPTLVVVEPMLPGLDGFRVIRALKASSCGDAPVVVAASRIFRGQRYRQGASEAGADLVIERPQEDEVLAAAFARCAPDAAFRRTPVNGVAQQTAVQGGGVGRACPEAAASEAEPDLDDALDRMFESCFAEGDVAGLPARGADGDGEAEMTGRRGTARRGDAAQPDAPAGSLLPAVLAGALLVGAGAGGAYWYSARSDDSTERDAAFVSAAVTGAVAPGVVEAPPPAPPELPVPEKGKALTANRAATSATLPQRHPAMPPATGWPPASRPAPAAAVIAGSASATLPPAPAPARLLEPGGAAPAAGPTLAAKGEPEPPVLPARRAEFESPIAPATQTEPVSGAASATQPETIPAVADPAPAPPPAPATEVVILGGSGAENRPARVLQRVPLVYPEAARRARAEGEVWLDVRVRADGSVADVTVVREPGTLGFGKAATAAVRRWRFAPALQGGAAVESTAKVVVQFRP